MCYLYSVMMTIVSVDQPCDIGLLYRKCKAKRKHFTSRITKNEEEDYRISQYPEFDSWGRMERYLYDKWKMDGKMMLVGETVYPYHPYHCAVEDCPGYVSVKAHPGRVRVVRDKAHTCGRSNGITPAHRRAVTYEYAKKDLSFKEAKSRYGDTFQVYEELTPGQYQRARNRVGRERWEVYLDGLRKLPSFLQKLKQLNPGTLVEYSLTQSNQLKYFTVFPSICLRAYKYVLWIHIHLLLLLFSFSICDDSDVTHSVDTACQSYFSMHAEARFLLPKISS